MTFHLPNEYGIPVTELFNRNEINLTEIRLEAEAVGAEKERQAILAFLDTIEKPTKQVKQIQEFLAGRAL
jgi:ABC-type Fe3+-hydroxamate transport system substrate-binding protein